MITQFMLKSLLAVIMLIGGCGTAPGHKEKEASAIESDAKAPNLVSSSSPPGQATRRDQGELPISDRSRDRVEDPNEIAPPIQDPIALATRRAEIQTMITDPSCDNDSECKLVGLGFEPCGHPTNFLPYSTKNTDQVVLAEKVRAHKQAERDHLPVDIEGVCGFRSPHSPQCLATSEGSSRCAVSQDAPFAKDEQIMWWGL